uniref:Uncharacterized protein n=1 Tax=Anguilla anguilla TaxID=7936 RepID=A0A0E9PGG9_ANGAN
MQLDCLWVPYIPLALWSSHTLLCRRMLTHRWR